MSALPSAPRGACVTLYPPPVGTEGTPKSQAVMFKTSISRVQLCGLIVGTAMVLRGRPSGAWAGAMGLANLQSPL